MAKKKRSGSTCIRCSEQCERDLSLLYCNHCILEQTIPEGRFEAVGEDTIPSFIDQLKQIAGTFVTWLFTAALGAIIVLFALGITGCATTFNTAADVNDGDVLVCVDTSSEDRCYKASSGEAAAEGTEVPE